jgi:uncharacterized protein YndB with AHSA1/START domain
MSIAPVRKELVIESGQAQCFRVFTEEHGLWWLLATHHIGEKDAQTAIIEPRSGGRWYERAADGTECLWGSVLAWEPPARIVLDWQTGANWKHDPDLHTEVEVRFIALGPARTRVELEHRHLARMGDAASKLREAFDSPGGWSGILGRFGDRAAKSS